ncbi:hypothetical protein FBU30_003467 [Linnemannia zychae]|nr:hypothetical protein FBU30_003467 [Linnemannia zychae]
MSFPPRFIRAQTPHAPQSSIELDTDNDITTDENNSFFPNLITVHSDNDDDNSDDDRDEGREQSDDIIILDQPTTSKPSPRFAFFSAPTAPVTEARPGNSYALLANKTSKRVRMTDPTNRGGNSSPILVEDDADYTPSTSSISKRVRFDESKNQVHWHHRNSSVSPPGSPSPIVHLKAQQPLVSALIRRSRSPSMSFDIDDSFTSVASSTSSGSEGNQSPEKFTLSLDNTSQEVMDFASSLTRLMGGGAQLGSQESDASISNVPNSFSFNSPLLSSASPRIFSPLFRASPPSPVRPPFMSYSPPPPTSSLSSCWSPTMDDDQDDSMETAARISSPAPVQKKVRAPFVPRRPRNTGNLSPLRPGAAPGAPRRFPSMLKREASNASFLDNYPASLAPDAEEENNMPSSSCASPPRSPAAVVQETVIPSMPTPSQEASRNSSIPQTISSFSSSTMIPSTTASMQQPSIPLLRKTISDIPLRSHRHNKSDDNSFWLDAQKIIPQFKKSASFDDFLNNQSNDNHGEKSLSQEDIIMSLAPLFPLQESPSVAKAGSSL